MLKAAIIGYDAIELICAISKFGADEKPVKLSLCAKDSFYTVKGFWKHAPYFYENPPPLPVRVESSPWVAPANRKEQPQHE